jgi:prepilin-type N-terminal cleavage/methylation domain-containing protein
MIVFAHHRRISRGFTLIEVVIAMGMLAALIILCSRLAVANIQLANGITAKQTENNLRESFFDMMKLQLSSLPGNTRMELQTTKGTQPYEYTLVLQNVPLAFTWGGVEKIAKAVEISGVKRRDGFLNVVMRYYENEILSDAENIANVKKEEPFAEVVLMDDLRFMEWQALDGRTMEWQNNWDLQGRLPLQLELVVAQGAYGDEIRQVFWIVPKVSPQAVVRSLGQGQQQGGGQTPGGGGVVVPGGELPGGGGGQGAPPPGK